MNGLPWLPPDGSAHGADIDRLLAIVHAFMAALFVVWIAYFIVTLARHRASRRALSGGRAPRGAFLAGTAITVLGVELVLDLFFSVPIWSARTTGMPAEHDATVVRIVAEQFAWNVHYPGRDGQFGRTSAALVDPFNALGLDRTDSAAKDDITLLNRLVIPAGKPVIAYLSSKDVVHSLNLPIYRVKQDAVPGLVTPVWFEPVKTTAMVREEMAADFSIDRAVSTRRMLRLPSVESLDVSGGSGRPEFLAAEDVLDSTGAPAVSAGDVLDESAVAAIVATGTRTVKARPKAGYDIWIALRDYADSSGAAVLSAYDPLTEDALTKLLRAGLSEVEARRASHTDPWLLHGSLKGPDGSEIGSDGAFLDEATITKAAAAGASTIRVAPVSPTEIACAQLCGLGHYQMRGEILVLGPREYQQWFEEQEATAAANNAQ